MILSLKPGVKLKMLQPQTVLALMICASVYENMRAQTCVVASVNDGKHSDMSLHYEGYAFDLRTKDFAGDRMALRDAIKAALGDNFDVVLEAVGEANEHIHVEFDPK